MVHFDIYPFLMLTTGIFMKYKCTSYLQVLATCLLGADVAGSLAAVKLVCRGLQLRTFCVKKSDSVLSKL